jgi:hypothetical protein
MAQVASAASRQHLSLTALIRSAWARIVQKTNQSMAKGLYGEDITFSDNLERELNQRELHPYNY